MLVAGVTWERGQERKEARGEQRQKSAALTHTCGHKQKVLRLWINYKKVHNSHGIQYNRLECAQKWGDNLFKYSFTTDCVTIGWPSGLRRTVKARISSEARVRISNCKPFNTKKGWTIANISSRSHFFFSLLSQSTERATFFLVRLPCSRFLFAPSRDFFFFFFCSGGCFQCVIWS